ncbi:hypothetical protein CH256_22575 [Rhodococcus sp. 05-2254-6]|nr:hypothetical protein CH256_22575 [Rhodococcus sp. 05-2254-6]
MDIRAHLVLGFLGVPWSRLQYGHHRCSRIRLGKCAQQGNGFGRKGARAHVETVVGQHDIDI